MRRPKSERRNLGSRNVKESWRRVKGKNLKTRSLMSHTTMLQVRKLNLSKERVLVPRKRNHLPELNKSTFLLRVKMNRTTEKLDRNLQAFPKRRKLKIL